MGGKCFTMFCINVLSSGKIVCRWHTFAEHFNIMGDAELSKALQKVRMIWRILHLIDFIISGLTLGFVKKCNDSGGWGQFNEIKINKGVALGTRLNHAFADLHAR